MRLDGKICVITGAGSGIGREAALLFAGEGASLVVADVMANAGEQTIDLVNKAGGTAVYTRVDVTKADEVEAMAAFAVDTYGKINVLFNNAGINNPSDDFLIADLSEEVWEEKISINLKGTYLCCKYVIPKLLQAGGGSIINNASNAGLVDLIRDVSYPSLR